MYRMISTGIEVIGRERAQDLMVLNTYPGQRALERDHVDHLKGVQAGGRFTTAKIGIATLLFNNGIRVLGNGQHTLSMTIESGIPFTATIEEVECDTEIDLANYFATFDSAMSVRGQWENIHAITTALHLKWPAKLGAIVLSAAQRRDNIKTKDPLVKQSLILKYRPFGNFLYNLFSENAEGINSKRYRFMYCSPVTYPILTTWQVSKEDCEKFWRMVKDGDQLERENGAKKLRDYLMMTSSAFGHSNYGTKRHLATIHEITSKCITAWNAYRRGEKTDLKYYREKPVPKAI